MNTTTRWDSYPLQVVNRLGRRWVQYRAAVEIATRVTPPRVTTFGNLDRGQAKTNKEANLQLIPSGNSDFGHK
jgi:hypothetical protein